MNDATVSWAASLTGTPTGYLVAWTVNGTAKPAVLVPATAQGDSAGYSLDAANSLGVTFAPGDTIPTAPVPPGESQSVALALS